jgi:DNA-binding transcriptional ArsR family regulator
MSRQPDRAVADVFFALSDETRLSVVKRLGAGAALSATALSDGAWVTRQAVAKHLQVLEGAGLVTHERRGREVVYVLDSGRLDEARAFLDEVSASWDRAIDRLRQAVEEPPPRPPKQRGRQGRR